MSQGKHFSLAKYDTGKSLLSVETRTSFLSQTKARGTEMTKI